MRPGSMSARPERSNGASRRPAPSRPLPRHQVANVAGWATARCASPTKPNFFWVVIRPLASSVACPGSFALSEPICQPPSAGATSKATSSMMRPPTTIAGRLRRMLPGSSGTGSWLSHATRLSVAADTSTGWLGPLPSVRSRSICRASAVAAKDGALPKLSVSVPATLSGRSTGPFDSTAFEMSSLSPVSVKAPSLRQPAGPVGGIVGAAVTAVAGGHLGDRIGAVPGQPLGRIDADRAVDADGDRPACRIDVGPDADRPVIEDAAGGDAETHLVAIVEIEAVDMPRPQQRPRRHLRRDAVEGQRHAGLLIGVVERAVLDGDVVEDDLVRVERLAQLHAAEPGDLAGRIDRDVDHRLLQGHRDHADFALEKRHQLDDDVEARHVHEALAALVVNLDLGEGQRRRRQDDGMGVAFDMDPVAKDARRLGLEAGAIIVPVDEPRHDQRREQRDNHGTPDDQVEPAQCGLRYGSMAGPLSPARRSCPGS